MVDVPYLFPGEKLDASAITEEAPALSDDDINEKYIKGDIRIVTEQARYPLTAISGMLSSGNYKRDPEFQRRHRWDDSKKSRLIESFIMNVPVPPIFLYEARFSYYEVMDGLQRLTAIDDFYNNRFALTDLSEWSELNGRTYQHLPEQVRKGIDRRYLSSIILLQETAKSEAEAQSLKLLVFERINSGGIKLEPQETRNAIYNGPLNSLCIRLARNKYLCRLWGIPEPDAKERNGEPPRQEVLANELYRKMGDVELVLRFFAYRQRLANHRGSLSAYLDLYLRLGNDFKPSVLTSLGSLFVDTIDLAHSLFGKEAFWLMRKRGDSWSWFQRPTTVVYDPLMYTLSQLLSRKDALLAQKNAVRVGIVDFYKTNYDLFEGRYTNLSNIADRNRQLGAFLSKYAG
jgi:hypothetical protein